MQFQAIVTKYHGPTNTRWSRISAKASAGKVMVDYDQGMSLADNHIAAAKALADKMGWGGHWAVGGMPDNSSCVFVCADANRRGELFKGPTIAAFTVAFSTLTKEG